LENTEEVPYTVEVDELTPLLPWLSRRRKSDLEAGPAEHLDSDSESFLKRTLEKIRGVVEFEVKTSADGLTTLFYEKGFVREDQEDQDEFFSDESSSDVNSPDTVSQRHPRSSHVRRLSDHDVSRSRLLNRGYCLCVAGCIFLACFFGSLGLLFDADAAGIAFVLVGFLISMSLEIVSVVRFIMYFTQCPPFLLILVRLFLTKVTGKVVIPGSPGLALLLLRWRVVLLFRLSQLVRTVKGSWCVNARETPWSAGTFYISRKDGYDCIDTAISRHAPRVVKL
jgi:hypothetical protein